MFRQHLLTLALLALLPGSLLADGQAPGDCLALPLSASGCSGLVRVPTADALPYGTYTLGVNVVDARHRFVIGKNTVSHFATVPVLPRVEVTARITNFDGNLGVQYRDTLPGMPMGGWNFDRSLGLHAQVARQTAKWPVAVAIGDQDVTGNDTFRARYVVASRRSGKLGLHLGLGNGWLGKPFGGVDFAASRQVRILLDHDGTRANAGISVAFHHFTVMPFLTGLKAFGSSVAYNRPF